MHGNRGAHSLHCGATAARAARPASLASSARTEVLEANLSQASLRNSKPEVIAAEVSIHVASGAATFWVRSFQSRSAEEVVLIGRAKGSRIQVFGKAEQNLPQTQALRRSQSQMQEAVQAPAAAQHVPVACVCLQAASPNAQCGLAVVHRPLPNPSIERTSPGKPGAASHLKR